MAGQLIFQLPTFHWPSKDQQMAFEEWQSHVTLTLEASNIPRERWYASIIGFLGTKGFKRWQHLDISKDVEKRKMPEDIFTAFANTLEVSMSQWNYINEMYSDITSERARNHWPARSMHQDLGWKVWLSNQQREVETLTGSYYFMQWSTLRSRSG